MSDLWANGALFHEDPDTLVALRFGYHDYEFIDDVKQAYVEGELGDLEFEAILEGAFERQYGLQQ